MNNGVEPASLKQRTRGGSVADVGFDEAHARGEAGDIAAFEGGVVEVVEVVEDSDGIAAREESFDGVRADESSAAREEDVHVAQRITTKGGFQPEKFPCIPTAGCIECGALQTQTITLGHSPDPDDAFMFYALTRGKLDTGGLVFQEVVEGIEQLNRRALEGELAVTALSVHAYAYVAERYALMASGGSFGDRVGPLVVARRPMQVGELADLRIAVPGTMTSAYLLLKLLLTNFRFEVVPFDRIPDAVIRGEVDAGLLIHEGQLTYRKLGLHPVVNLGEWWHADTGLPVPLGVNAIRKDLGQDVMRQVVVLLNRSIQYALSHRSEAVAYAMQYARGMDATTTDSFVEMYVNSRTVEMGEQGRAAIVRLLTRGYHAGWLPRPVQLEFVQ